MKVSWLKNEKRKMKNAIFFGKWKMTLMICETDLFHSLMQISIKKEVLHVQQFMALSHVTFFHV